MIVKSSATLRINSASLTAAAITDILGIAPSKSYEKGDLVSARSPKPIYRQSAMWQWSSQLGETSSINEHLGAICKLLDEKKDKIQFLKNCQLDIFCGVFSDSEQIGFDLDHQTILALSVYPIDLVFDAYGVHSE